jgi:hypothetical protein
MRDRVIGIAVLVVILLALNGLSYAFDWGWVFY